MSGLRGRQAPHLGRVRRSNGYHRKHAIRILNTLDVGTARRHGGRHPLYNEAVRQALVILWEASDRICGKRLRPLLPVLLPALEAHGHLGDACTNPSRNSARTCGPPSSGTCATTRAHEPARRLRVHPGRRSGVVAHTWPPQPATTPVVPDATPRRPLDSAPPHLSSLSAWTSTRCRPRSSRCSVRLSRRPGALSERGPGNSWRNVGNGSR